ncbi:MAG: hypothetical protein ACPL5I_14360 [Thermodesulfobacteriota bacterium]
MKNIIILIYCLALALAGCTYTVRHTEGTKLNSAQIQDIKLGKTTEAELIRLLGPPSRKEKKPDGSEVLHYIYTQIESPTLWGGVVLHGFLEKDREEIFEVILKEGVVQSFHYLKQ